MDSSVFGGFLMCRLFACRRCIGLGVSVLGLVVTMSCGRADSEPARLVADVVAGDLRSVETGSALHDIRDITYDPDGRIWILSGFDPFVHVINMETNVVSRFGSRGRGPGELRVPWYFVDRGEAAAPKVWDVGNRKLLEYDLEGGTVSELQVEANLGIVIAGYRETQFGKPLKVAELDSVLIVQAFDDVVARSGHLWSGALIRLTAAGASSDTVLRFSTLNGRQAGEEYSVFEPAPLWAACANGTVAVLDPDTDQIGFFDATGSQADRWSLDLPDISVLRSDVEAFIRHDMDAEIREQGGGPDLESAEGVRFLRAAVTTFVASSPERAPAVGLECDDKGRVWVQLFSTERDARGYGRYWVVNDGIRSLIVEFPPGFQGVRFLRGTALGYAVDGMGVQSPAVVVLPEGLR